MDRILKEERKYVAELVKKIVSSGCNTLFIQKSMIKEAYNELTLNFLAKKNIMTILNFEREDLEFICKTIGAIPISHIDQMRPEKFGSADLIEEIRLENDQRVLKVTGVPAAARTMTIFCRGSNQLIIDEAERSIHDALCVVRSLVKTRGLLPGGGAPEAEISVKL